MKNILFLIATVCFSSATYAVSFDCNKASTFVLEAICSDPSLGSLDDKLSELYRQALSSFDEVEPYMDQTEPLRELKELKSSEIRWIHQRNKCTNNECIERAYRQRIRHFEEK